ncbi:MAG TPA: hypothetical protein VK208_01835 [Pyrinomonadaceae bacterium]|nr:hypothetical protein [Pyrinomonadaceae bacterium]
MPRISVVLNTLPNMVVIAGAGRYPLLALIVMTMRGQAFNAIIATLSQ